jgi:hypothetical protein
MSTSSPLPRPSVTADARTAHADERMAPPAVPSEAELAEAWFDAPPASSRRPSSVPPPPPVSAVGEFLGDPLADAWLR